MNQIYKNKYKIVRILGVLGSLIGFYIWKDYIKGQIVEQLLYCVVETNYDIRR